MVFVYEKIFLPPQVDEVDLKTILQEAVMNH